MNKLQFCVNRFHKYIGFIQVPKTHVGPQIEVGLSGHRMHGPHQYTTEMKKLFNQLPQWTTTTGWASAYKSYTL